MILTIASVSSSASQVSSHWSVLGSILFPAARNLGKQPGKEMLEIGSRQQDFHNVIC